jgi:carboxypeptidase C (cathepsin A)
MDLHAQTTFTQQSIVRITSRDIAQVPTVATAIVAYNEGTSTTGGFEFNLKGIAIGNGWVDPFTQYAGYGPFAFANGIIDATVYGQMNDTVVQCRQLIARGDLTNASNVCGGIMGAVMDVNPTMNFYNIHTQCDPPPLCYDFDNISDYLNNPLVQQKLGVDQINWTTCNFDVNAEFGNDIIESFVYEVADVNRNFTRNFPFCCVLFCFVFFLVFIS